MAKARAPPCHQENHTAEGTSPSEEVAEVASCRRPKAKAWAPRRYQESQTAEGTAPSEEVLLLLVELISNGHGWAASFFPCSA